MTTQKLTIGDKVQYVGEEAVWLKGKVGKVTDCFSTGNPQDPGRVWAAFGKRELLLKENELKKVD